MKKKWCRHIKLNEAETVFDCWLFDDSETVYSGFRVVSKQWTRCPICGTPRPKRRKVK